MLKYKFYILEHVCLILKNISEWTDTNTTKKCLQFTIQYMNM